MSKQPISEQLKKKYHKCEEVTNFKDMIDRSAEVFKTRTAFKLKDKEGNIYSKTYEELKADIVNLGTELINQGLLNKRIAIIGKNSYNWAISYLAAAIVGVVVPIDKELHSEDVINFMNVAKCECILGDSKNLNQIKENISSLENKNTIFIAFENKDFKSKEIEYKLIEEELEKGNKLVQEGNTKFEEIKVDPDEMRILLFTSGTTRKCKRSLLITQKYMLKYDVNIWNCKSKKK